MVNTRLYMIYDYDSYYGEDGIAASKKCLIPAGGREYMGMLCIGSGLDIAAGRGGLVT